ncbi:tyrosine recombinase XerC [Pseudidiomarina terrestris]|uniref:Tyrosine recombinase XerC n=1 Tax=Pseudidiomarina terrestris TaxID=2820060 RepID=A0AAW7QX24_9GAMM|nr:MULTISPECIES: tyrosine recombinase XerC [unclassified Pseudidiomarina]MDN7124717.1 tyrosine recombinase XerC [Pseudidiomarina sp. 1APP75-32.1]MDN7129809.1 tyrosine recombinase XerC [Pseudidiomarina sp. 1APR75-15]MDN7136414.1 tyrosine recombinase XerC [Pseudidiomarina sp. 1ASP75-5]MDN7137934.1 tyrosine recombinase XerC [Pseudidiomarina sp. 1ASP75-14]MEA3588296.1 tyrosine recombinase XerC [Pseudidiomarina sp. 1APP75-27a]
MKLAEVRQKFLNHLAGERGLAEHTLSNYGRVLRHDIDFFDSEGIDEVKGIGVSQFERLFMQWRRQGLGDASLALRLAAWRSCFDYCIRQGWRDDNPARQTKAPKSAKRLPKNLDVDSISQLLKLPEDDELAIRDAAIMELLYGSGLRLAELVALDIDAINPRHQELRVLGKGGKTRIVPYGRCAAEALRKWLPVRNKWLHGHLTEVALFISQRQRRISPRTVQQRLNHWGRQQGLNGSLHPHKLRHSFASHMLESSGDLRAVQELLGHANLSTTQVYTHLDFQHLSKVYDAAHPRARKK